jgi:hypothetical protein
MPMTDSLLANNLKYRIYRRFITVLLPVLASFSLWGQDFDGGVLAGFNGSQVDGDLAKGYHKMGLIGGAWIQRELSEDFFWGMELKFIQKGSRINPTNRNGNWKFIYRLNYIELPMLIGYNYQPFYFFTGLSFATLMSKSGYNSFGEDPLVMYDETSNWELGMFAGIKVDFEHLVSRGWAKQCILETRFQYSLLSINKPHDLFTNYFSVGHFNNVISTVLYYRIEWPSQRR